MRGYVSKTENSGATADGRLSAEEDSVRFYEMAQAALSMGITLDPYGGPDTDKTMLAQALARAASAGVWFQDTGAANAYVLSTPGAVVMPKALFSGMKAKWIPGNTSTSTTATANVAGLGVKSILRSNGGALSIGDIVAGREIEMTYSPSANSGAGAWLLLYWVTASTGGGGGGTSPTYTLNTGLGKGFSTMNAVQSVPTNIWTTVTATGTVVNDTTSTFSAGAFTVAAADAGWWNLGAYTSFNSGSGVSNAVAVAIIVNGTTIFASADNDWQAGIIVYDASTGGPWKLATGDVVTCMVKHAHGSTLNTYQHRFSGMRTQMYSLAS